MDAKLTSSVTRARRIFDDGLAMTIAAILAFTATAVYLRHLDIEQRAGSLVETIAQTRAAELAAWLHHRTSETEFVLTSRLMADLYTKWHDRHDQASLDSLQERLTSYRRANEYHSALILDEHAQVISRDQDQMNRTIGPELRDAAMQALATGKVQRTSIYRRDTSPLPNRMDFVIPLIGSGTPARGLVVLRINPEDFIFPVIRSWPANNVSGHSALVRREGEELVVLGGPHKTGQAMPRIKLEKVQGLSQSARSTPPGPAVTAVDYRGIKVIGVARLIAGSDWTVVTKIDYAEIIAATLRDALWIALVGFISIIAAIAIASSRRTREALQFAAIRHHEQAKQLQTLQLLNAIADSSTDAIFAKDRDGNYLLFNREACRVTGKLESQIIGRDDRTVFPPEHAEIIIRNDATVIAENRSITKEETIKTPQGETIFLTTKGPLHDAAGNVIGTYGISHDITRRKRDEMKIAQAAARLQAIQDSIENQMVVLDRDGVIVAVNEAWKTFALENSRTAGVIPANTGIATSYLDICRNAEGESSEEAAAACEGLRQVLGGERENFSIEYPCHAPTEQRWFMMNAVPLRSAEGGAVVVHTNITARKRNELLQAEQSRILELVTADTAMPDVLDAIARSVDLLGDDAMCSILLTDEAGTHLLHGAGPGLPAAYNAAINGIAIGPGVGCCGTAAFTRSEVIVEDTLTHPYWREFAALAQQHGLRSCWSTPIIAASGQLLGTFALYGRRTGGISDWHRQLIAFATHLAAVSITHARSRAAVLSSEQRFRSMVESLTEGIVMFDGEGHVVAVNPAAEKLFGYSEAEIIERWRDPRASPSPLDENGRPLKYEDRAVARAIATGEPQLNVIHGRAMPDGSVRWNIVNARPVCAFENGPVTSVIASFTDITERRTAEQQLLKFSQAVKQSFNSIMITDSDARIEFVNDAFCRVSGYAREELLGRNPRMFKSGLTPKSNYVAMWETLTRGDAWKGEFTNRRKNGEIFSEVAHITPLRSDNGTITHYLGIREDITERKRIGEELDRHRFHLEELVVERTRALELSNAALRKSEDFVKTITDNVPGLVSYWDHEMCCRFANKAYFQWWGKTPEQMLNRTISEIVAPEELDKYEPRMAAALRGEPQHIERSHRLENGRTGYTYAHYIPETENGRVIGFYVLGTDITAVKEAELRLQELNAEISQARDFLQQHNTDLANEVEQRKRAEDEARGLNKILDERKQSLERLVKNLETFSYSVSHDLRAPLRAISGYAEMLGEAEADRLTEDGRHMLERVIAGARKMDKLIKDILEYSRVERLKRRDSVIDMAALTRQIAEEQLVTYAQAQFVMGDLPAVNADATMVQQILTNLISNAFKFSAKRSDARIEVGATMINGTPEFYVKDNGAGFNQKYAGKLFTLFQRMHSESEFAGTGVGLAVVKRLIEHHGGRISAESVPGEQTVFRFTLAPDLAAIAAA